jgi:hypothetical protein
VTTSQRAGRPRRGPGGRPSRVSGSWRSGTERAAARGRESPRPRRTSTRSRGPTRRVGPARGARPRPGCGSPRASGGGSRSAARPRGRRPRSATPRRAAAAGSSRCSGRPGGDVVGPAPLPVDGAVPEDRVTDEPAVQPAIEQAVEPTPGAGGLNRLQTIAWKQSPNTTATGNGRLGREYPNGTPSRSPSIQFSRSVSRRCRDLRTLVSPGFATAIKRVALSRASHQLLALLGALASTASSGAFRGGRRR